MMRDAFSISEPYDETLVDEMFARFDAIKSMTELGTSALPLIPTTPTNCVYCPNFFPLSNDFTESCNGK